LRPENCCGVEEQGKLLVVCQKTIANALMLRSFVSNPGKKIQRFGLYSHVTFAGVLHTGSGCSGCI
jgi:hypothetical protein